jgi:hypothetical protein
VGALQDAAARRQSGPDTVPGGIEDLGLDDRIVFGRTIVIPIVGERLYMDWIEATLALPMSDENAEGAIPISMLAGHLDEYASEHSA